MSKNFENMRILNISEAAKFSGYSRGTVEYWIREGLLPFESPPGQGKGRKRFIKNRKVDLDAFLDSYHQKQEPYIFKQNVSNSGGVTLLPRT